MPRQKTTQAEHFSARLNPVTSPEDRAALEIIHDLEDKGYNFKQIVVDAILKASGHTPEMFARHNPSDLLLGIENLLERFTGEIIGQIRQGNISLDDIADADANGNSPFMQNFTKSFVQRQGGKK
jgi:hypothetical protein